MSETMAGLHDVEDVDVTGRFVALGSPSIADDTPECPAGLLARHADVGLLLARLVGAARTLLLYDPDNETARRSLASLLASFEAVLEDGDVVLAVEPAEIRYEGRVVYRDEDRERSLACRLHRDGVRTLVFRPGLDAREAARLLEILSARFADVRAHEDDVVTLFWKAGLRGVAIVAVEGPVPDEGKGATAEAAAGSGEDAATASLSGADEAVPEWVEVSDARMRALRAEASRPLSEDGLRLVAGLVAGLENERDEMRLAEIAPLVREIRDALLAGGELAPLMRLVRQLQHLARSMAPWDPERHALAVRLLLSCGSDRSIRRLLHSVPTDDPILKREMIEFLDVVCPDPLTAVGEALRTEERRSSRAVARQLVEHYGRRREQQVRQRFDASQGRVAADYLRSLARLEKEAAMSFVARQTAHPDEEVRQEALWQVERAAFSAPLGYALVEAVRRTSGDHRRRLLGLIERSGDRRFVRPLLAIALSEGADLASAVDVGRVVGRLEGDAGLARWRPVLTPKGRFFRRRLSGTVREQVVAAAAASQAPGREGVRLIGLAHSAARADSRAWMEALLDEARTGGRR